MFFHPKIAEISCEDCSTWMYNDKKDREYRNDGNGGKIFLKRLPMCPPPCDTCPKTEGNQERTRANACQGLNEKNKQALQHYLECKAVGQFPDDPIVKRNAAIIGPYYDAMDQSHQYRIFGTMFSMMGLGTEKNG